MAVTPEVLAENVVPVLDHGFLALDGSLASDLAVVNGARVSFNQASDEMGERDEGLIRFLMRERHGSPFEHGYFRFVVKAPLFVVREHHRHRAGHSYNEWSGRYAKMEPEFYVPENVRTQVGKPGAYSFEPVEDEVRENARREIEENATRAFQAYERMLEQGVAKEVARAKAESLLAEIRKGGDFDQIAKRESMDPGSKELGGDLGWNRRGNMVPEFDRWMFALAPGQMSPVIETPFGYHIIRVDRVQPGEVKARHILIKPHIDSADVAAAKLRADTVKMLWEGGANFDSLVARYHDRDEEKGSLQPFERTQLPDSYRKAFEGKSTGAYIDPFPIDDPARGAKKYVVAQIVKADDGGDYTLSDFKSQIRDQLAQERGMRRVIDQMRKDLYVSVRI